MAAASRWFAEFLRAHRHVTARPHDSRLANPLRHTRATRCKLRRKTGEEEGGRRREGAHRAACFCWAMAAKGPAASSSSFSFFSSSATLPAA
eukprot:2151007-Rhodomonas_salina.1